jgi:hypothetical protein
MTAVEASEHLLVAGFDAVVECLGDPFPQLSEQRAGILARRGDPQQPTQQRHVAQVGFHHLRDARILHLHRHRTAIIGDRGEWCDHSK